MRFFSPKGLLDNRHQIRPSSDRRPSRPRSYLQRQKNNGNYLDRIVAGNARACSIFVLFSAVREISECRMATVNSRLRKQCVCAFLQYKKSRAPGRVRLGRCTKVHPCIGRAFAIKQRENAPFSGRMLSIFLFVFW